MFFDLYYQNYDFNVEREWMNAVKNVDDLIEFLLNVSRSKKRYYKIEPSLIRKQVMAGFIVAIKVLRSNDQQALQKYVYFALICVAIVSNATCHF